ncbi:MAG: hypothetical protein ACJAUE_002161 [Alcanivorax sp.]
MALTGVELTTAPELSRISAAMALLLSTIAELTATKIIVFFSFIGFSIDIFIDKITEELSLPQSLPILSRTFFVLIDITTMDKTTENQYNKNTKANIQKYKP